MNQLGRKWARLNAAAIFGVFAPVVAAVMPVTTNAQAADATESSVTSQQANSLTDLVASNDEAVSDTGTSNNETAMSTADTTNTAGSSSTTSKTVSADQTSANASSSSASSQTQTSLSRSSLARATADTVASGVIGTVTWTIDSAGVLHLSGGQWGYLVSADSSASPWAQSNPPDVTFSGGDYAGLITSVSIEGEITRNTSTGGALYRYLFSGLTNLTTISGLENLNLSGVTDVSNMFSKDLALTSVDFGNAADFSSVTTMENMFLNDKDLVSVNLGTNADVSKVTTTASMFNTASALTSVSIGLGNFENATTMSKMFFMCLKLTNLNLSQWDVSQVVDMTQMFYDDTSLISLDVSGWQPTALQDMTSMFNFCQALTSLDLSKWQTPNLKNLTMAFTSCMKLQSLNIGDWQPGALTGTALSQTFSLMSALTSLDLSKWDVSNVTGLYMTFRSDYNLTDLKVSTWDTSKVTNFGSTFLGMYNVNTKTGIQTLDLSNWDTRAATSYSNMFKDDTLLQHVTLGKNFSFHDSTGMALPDASSTAPYTGKWQLGTGSDATSYTASDLMTSYDGSTMAGQYNWAKLATVTVKYVDTDGTSIADDEVLSGNNGEAYTTTAKTLAGYELTTTPDNATGTYDGNQTVTYVYQGALFFGTTPAGISFGDHALTGSAVDYTATPDGTMTVQDNRSLGSSWTLYAREDKTGFMDSTSNKHLPATLLYGDQAVGTDDTAVMSHETENHTPVDVSTDWTDTSGLRLKVASDAVTGEYHTVITWTLGNTPT